VEILLCLVLNILAAGEFREQEMHAVEPVVRESSFSNDVIAARRLERLSLQKNSLLPGG
jgi:hypothetical protein